MWLQIGLSIVGVGMLAVVLLPAFKHLTAPQLGWLVFAVAVILLAWLPIEEITGSGFSIKLAQTTRLAEKLAKADADTSRKFIEQDELRRAENAQLQAQINALKAAQAVAGVAPTQPPPPALQDKVKAARRDYDRAVAKSSASSLEVASALANLRISAPAAIPPPPAPERRAPEVFILEVGRSDLPSAAGEAELGRVIAAARAGRAVSVRFRGYDTSTPFGTPEKRLREANELAVNAKDRFVARAPDLAGLQLEILQGVSDRAPAGKRDNPTEAVEVEVVY